MKTRCLIVASAVLICLSLAATLSVSGAQDPISSETLRYPHRLVLERTPVSPEAQMAPLRPEAVEPLLLPATPVILAQEKPPTASVEYFDVETKMLGDGTSIDQVTINGPPTPPQGFERDAAELLAASREAGLVTLSDVPAYDWSYGCSATSAAMIAAYYDRTLYPDVYTGPTNGGVMPMDNSVWGHTTWPRCDEPGTTSVGECPLSATHSGIDGRSTKGHVDDYWTGYGCSGPDPYVTNVWSEHAPGDCTGDYMKTNKWFSGYSFNRDGETVFYYYTNGAQTPASDLVASGPPYSYDGGLGLKLFFESRGYSVSTAYNQYVRGQGSNPSLGFTYGQYKAEIDAGRPVMIQLEGHTMVGVGYDDTSSDLVYVHDTWDYNTYTMTWGGSYSGMDHLGVTVVQLAPSTPAPTVTSITPNTGFYTETVHITSLVGSNFQSGAAVRLTKGGQPDIGATSVTVASATLITCDVDLTGAAVGLWNVVVTNPDLQQDILPDGFMVKAPGGGAHFAYLPSVFKRYPPIPDAPVLNLVNNPDGDGDYTVSWNAAYLADTYVLQEDDNPAFRSPKRAYSGPEILASIAGQSPGTYYYRVKASNGWGDSRWSNVRQVVVRPPMAEVYVENDTGGKLCYEVDGTGIGQKCFSSGTHYYGTFPSRTYTWHASAWCGSDSGTRYYEPGVFTHWFWCE